MRNLKCVPTPHFRGNLARTQSGHFHGTYFSLKRSELRAKPCLTIISHSANIVTIQHGFFNSELLQNHSVLLLLHPPLKFPALKASGPYRLTFRVCRSDCGSIRSRWRSTRTKCTCSPPVRGDASSSANSSSRFRRNSNRNIRNASRHRDVRVCRWGCDSSPTHRRSIRNICMSYSCRYSTKSPPAAQAPFRGNKQLVLLYQSTLSIKFDPYQSISAGVSHRP